MFRLRTFPYLAFILVCLPSICAVDRIPSPNVCKPKSAFSWTSDDCPYDAQCVPKHGNHTSGYCACGFSADMLTESDGKCQRTASTYVYGSYFIILILACFVIAFSISRSILRLYRDRALKFNFFSVSYMLALLCALFEIVHRGVRVVILFGRFESMGNSSQYVLASRIHVVALSLFVMLCVATLIIFGLAVYSFAQQSAQMRTMNSKSMNRKVFLFASTFGSFIFVGNLILLVLGQTAISNAFTGFFVFLLWIFYNRVMKQISKLCGHSNSTGSLGVPRVSFGVTDSKKADTDFKIQPVMSVVQLTVLQVELLSSRLVLVQFVLSMNAFCYLAVSLIGMHKRDKLLLGRIPALLTGIHFGVITIAIAFVAVFTNNVTNLRHNRALRPSVHGSIAPSHHHNAGLSDSVSMPHHTAMSSQYTSARSDPGSPLASAHNTDPDVIGATL